MQYFDLPYNFTNSDNKSVSKFNKKVFHKRVPLLFHNFDSENFLTDSYLKIQSLIFLNKFIGNNKNVLASNKNFISRFLYHSSLNICNFYINSSEYFPVSDYESSNILFHNTFKKFSDFFLHKSLSKNFFWNKIYFSMDWSKSMIILFLGSIQSL